MANSKEIKKGLIGHVIAAIIFLSILEPLLRFAYKLLAEYSNQFFTSYVNSIYENAAIHGETQTLVFMISILIFQALLAFFFMAGFKTFLQVEHLGIRENLIVIDDTKTQSIAHRMRRARKMLTWVSRHLKLIRWVYSTLAFFCFLGLLHIIFMAYTTIQLNMSFDQRLTAISPYLNQTDEKLIKSKWATMETKEDFISLNNELETIARINKVKLPKNLLN
jgi:hypothetical protein